MSGASHEVVVIGGGLSGLSAALELEAGGADVLLLEAADELGGHLRAEQHDGYAYAHGPQAIPGRARSAWRLVAALGLQDRVVPARAAERRWVAHAGRPVLLPSGPAGFLTSRFLSVGGKLRLLSEPFRRPPERRDEHESVRSFFSRRLGREAAERLVSPFVTGIYAGDPEQLEARSAFPQLVRWEEEAGSLVKGALRGRRGRRSSAGVPSGGSAAGESLDPEAGATSVPRRGLFSLEGGLATVGRAAAARLGQRARAGVRVEELRLESGCVRLETSDGTLTARRVVAAVPPSTASRLLRGLDAEAARLAGSVPLAPVAVVHLGGPTSSRTPEGFGVLVPRGEGLTTLGTVFTSALFPDRAPPGAWLQASYVGGVGAPEALELPDDELIRTVAEETRRLFDFDPDGGAARVIRHREAIPQLVRGHADRVRALRERLAAGAVGGRLALGGSWLDGVGVDHAAASGRRAARETLAGLATADVARAGAAS